MKLGGRYKLREIQARHLAQTARVVGVDGAWMLDTAGRLAAGLPAAVEQAIDEAGDVLDGSARHEFSAGLAARTSAAARTLATARTEGAAADAAQLRLHSHDLNEAGQSAATDAIWVETHQRGGRTVPGHWRRRPGRL